MSSIQGLLGVCVLMLGLAGCNHDDECASSDGCSSPGTYAGYGGNVGTGSGDEPGVACVISADSCVWRPLTGSDNEARLSERCTYDDHGVVASNCPTENLSGCCANTSQIDCYYNPAGLRPDMRYCVQQGGTWLSTAP